MNLKFNDKSSKLYLQMPSNIGTYLLVYFENNVVSYVSHFNCFCFQHQKLFKNRTYSRSYCNNIFSLPYQLKQTSLHHRFQAEIKNFALQCLSAIQSVQETLKNETCLHTLVLINVTNEILPIWQQQYMESIHSFYFTNRQRGDTPLLMTIYVCTNANYC